jgi:hypothetical protein
METIRSFRGAAFMAGVGISRRSSIRRRIEAAVAIAAPQ